MKKSFLLATVLVSNIVFAQVIPSPKILIQVNKLQNNSLSNMAIASLTNRGLEADIAQKKVETVLGRESFKIDLMSHNFVSIVDEVCLEDLLEYISDAALFEKKLDLSSYASLVSITQNSVGANLKKETLERLHRVAAYNRKIANLS